ncbi:putative ribonuclease H-like domain-containing protein [Tanacetum coccineum]
MTKLTQKKVKFEWGDKQEAAFQLLKQKLCSAPILALPEGSEDFIAYCDASKKGLGAVLMQREKDLKCQRCSLDQKSLQYIQDPKRVEHEATPWIRSMLSDYDCDIRYHPGKQNCIAEALRAEREREPPLRSSLNQTACGYHLESERALTATNPQTDESNSERETTYLTLFVTPKTSHLSAVKRIFRYLKGKPKLGLWYPRVSLFDLEAYSNSDYAGANLDRKSTTGEAEYVAAANYRGQVLWIQNQMLDYGFNFMNTKIYIDNESTICIVKNPIYHSKTKHIAIRHHFIRDAYEKKLIHVLKIHTDDNVADLLTKAFDVSRLCTKKDSSNTWSYLGFRESLERDIDGTEELMLPDLFIFLWTKVCTDSTKLILLGKDSTAIKTLEKIPPRV